MWIDLFYKQFFLAFSFGLYYNFMPYNRSGICRIIREYSKYFKNYAFNLIGSISHFVENCFEHFEEKLF